MKPKKIQEFINFYHKSEENGKVIVNIEYPFSTKCMDSSHQFSSSVIPEVRDYCVKEFGVFPDQVLLLACFLSGEKSEPSQVTFSSSVRLSVLKFSSGEHLAVLFLGGEIVRK